MKKSIEMGNELMNSSIKPSVDSDKNIGKRIPYKAIISFYFLGFTILIPLVLYNLFSIFSYDNPLVFQISVYAVTLVILLEMALPLLRYDIKRISPNFIKLLLKYLAFLYIANIIIGSLLFSLFSLSSSENQNSLVEMQDLNPFLYFILVAIMAPIVEEIVFRGAIFKSIKRLTSPKIAILFSSFLFGLIHVLGSLLTGNLIDVLNIILYMSLGIFFALVYKETDNIYAPIFLHSLYNTLAFLLILLNRGV